MFYPKIRVLSVFYPFVSKGLAAQVFSVFFMCFPCLFTRVRAGVFDRFDKTRIIDKNTKNTDFHGFSCFFTVFSKMTLFQRPHGRVTGK